VIVCLRTVGVPEADRARFLAWIEDNRAERANDEVDGLDLQVRGSRAGASHL
jgi:hypothetical protein